MKLKIKQLAIVLTIAIAALINPKQISAQGNNVNFQIFYDELSPYGDWVDYQNYGYVWVPNVGPNFVPYSTAGYWTLTNYGWTWVSDYEWGWAPFHYGRWSYDNYYGWLWVPDSEWGPSWVNWRRADGYYGWSPMEPGISINLSFNRPYNRYNDHWMFVRDRDFERRDLNRYFVDRSDNASIISNSIVINTVYIDNSRHTTYITGPAREDVQRVMGRRISPVPIRENSRPGQEMDNGQLRLYRPQVIKNGGSDNRPAPRRIENLENVKRPSERNVPSQQQNNSRQQNINRDQPTQQPQQTAPAGNRERQQQQNDTRQQNINKERQLQQQQQQNDPRQQNINRERQQQQYDSKQQNINKERQLQQQQQQQNDTRQQNINRERQQQQNDTRQQNINRAQPVHQPRTSAPAGNIQRQQPAQVKPQDPKTREQLKKRQTIEEKKQNE